MRLLGGLRDVDGMGRPDLLALRQEVFETPAPRMLSQPFLRRFIAFELQSRRHGGCPAR